MKLLNVKLLKKVYAKEKLLLAKDYYTDEYDLFQKRMLSRILVSVF
jgi:hypothetical protein